MSDNASANITVRIDNAAAKPDLRMQLVDDRPPPISCWSTTALPPAPARAAPRSRASASIRAAAKPDLTVALSRAPAAYKIYVRSAGFSQQDAAALFAAIWHNARKTAGSGREFAARN